VKIVRNIVSGALALGLLLPLVGSIAPAGVSAAQTATPPPPLPKNTPTPIPRSSATALPYPAYGTPAPGVSKRVANPAVPQQITLSQAIAIAAAKSPVLASARAAYDLSKGQLDQSRSGILPNVSGVGSITHSLSGSRSSTGTTGTGTGGTGSTGTLGGSFTSESLDLSLRQLIFDGGRTISQIHSASSSYAAAANTYERSLETLAFNVAQAYYNALQAQSATALAAQVVRQDVVQENLVRAQISAGTEARSNLLTAEFPTAQARVSLVRAQGTQLSALAAFANELGLDANTDVTPKNDTPANPTASLLKNPPLDYDTAVSRALSLRPDYLGSQRQVEAAQYTLKAAKLGRFPSLSGSASAGTASTTPSGGNFRGSSSVGATLTIPIFDQGITAAQTEQAQAQLDNANALSLNTKLGVQLNVRQALAGLISAQAAVGQTQVELANAQESLRATQAQYRAGVTTLPLLLNAQVGLTTAETDRLTAVYALRQAEQTYLYAIGESDLSPATG
jgi:outer membrane protein